MCRRVGLSASLSVGELVVGELVCRRVVQLPLNFSGHDATAISFYSIHNVADCGVLQPMSEEVAGKVGHVINSLSANHAYLKTLYIIRDIRTLRMQDASQLKHFSINRNPTVTLTSLPALSLQHTEVELYSGRREEGP